jgi:uncharacterized YigZ family protein
MGELTTSIHASGFSIPAVATEVEYEIKKSRFIARAAFAASRSQALHLLEQARQDYPDARHHCWAYLIGDPNTPKTMAMSDAGEPNGTAGKPILNVLQHKNIGNVMLVVIRYFGGIKLGAGGLVRAYSHSAQLAMNELTTSQFNTSSECRVRLSFSQEQAFRHWLKHHCGKVIAVDYQQYVDVEVTLSDDQLSAMKIFLAGINACIIGDIKPYEY